MIRPNGSGASRSRRVPRSRADDPIRAARAAAGLWCSPEGQPTSCGWRRFLPSDSWRASSRPMPVIFSASRLNGAMELLRVDGHLPDIVRSSLACSPAFGGHPASIVPAAYSSVPKTGQNRRTSRPHLALRGTTWHYVAQGAPYMYAYMRVRRTSGIATSCHPAQLPREDRARPPGRRATVDARGR